MDLKQFKTTEQRVKALLESEYLYRNSDVDLCLRYWKLETGLFMDSITVTHLMTLIEEKMATPQSTILRARRKVNKDYPHTRGKSYKGRKEKEEVIRKNINK